MNPFDYIFNDIQKNGNLSAEHKKIVKNAMNDHIQRMRIQHPNYDLFITGTGQSYGLMIEKRIIDSFDDLTKHDDDSAYDANHGTERVEIKSIKCTHGKSSEYIGSRIITYTPNNKKSKRGSGSFQQVKPQECDWFIFHLLYGNAERIFVVPAKMFSKKPGKNNKEPGKLLLSKQHRSHPYEGQANIGTILNTAEFFEIQYPYTSNGSQKYSFREMIKTIADRLDKINWKLPN